MLAPFSGSNPVPSGDKLLAACVLARQTWRWPHWGNTEKGVPETSIRNCESATGGNSYSRGATSARACAVDEDTIKKHIENLAKNTLKGFRRTLGTAPVQKARTLTEGIPAMRSATDGGIIGARDRALILLEFSGAFRRVGWVQCGGTVGAQGWRAAWQQSRYVPRARDPSLAGRGQLCRARLEGGARCQRGDCRSRPAEHHEPYGAQVGADSVTVKSEKALDGFVAAALAMACGRRAYRHRRT